MWSRCACPEPLRGTLGGAPKPGLPPSSLRPWALPRGGQHHQVVQGHLLSWPSPQRKDPHCLCYSPTNPPFPASPCHPSSLLCAQEHQSHFPASPLLRPPPPFLRTPNSLFHPGRFVLKPHGVPRACPSRVQDSAWSQRAPMAGPSGSHSWPALCSTAQASQENGAGPRSSTSSSLWSCHLSEHLWP